MSRIPAVAATPTRAVVPVSRPHWPDYWLILIGCALSFFLYQTSGPFPRPGPDAPDWVAKELFGPVPVLGLMLALPRGILLFWPLFYFRQKLRGRPQPLTAGEWLWVVAWVGTLLLAGWDLWVYIGQPDFAGDLYPPQSIWTIIALPLLAGAALVIGVLSFFRRWHPPWTHSFGLVLLVWPIIPLAGLLLWARSNWHWGPFPGLG